MSIKGHATSRHTSRGARVRSGGGLTGNKVKNVRESSRERPKVRAASPGDPPPLKWSDLRYVFDIKEDCNGKEAIQA